MLNLNDIAEQAYLLAKQRGFETDVLSTLKHCAGEVLEATEAYTNLSYVSTSDRRKAKTEEVGLEIADIIICALTASVRLNIDIEEYIGKAMQKNAQRAYQEQNNETA